MTSSGDEFDAYNFQEFTADDLASLDSILARGDITPNANMAGPAVTIEVEQPANHPIVNGSLTRAPSSATGLFPRRDRSSPFQQYRWKKVISVSDLVSPAWCEVQFDYGLRQKRFKKLEERPASFTSAEGKKIFVEKKVAAQNDRSLQRGKSVHKQLEKEIRPVEVHVDIVTEEERWALRLVNILSGIHSLLTLGCTREMPVFGVVHDHIVVGIIDELLRKPVPVPVSNLDAETSNNVKRSSESSHATPKSKRARRSPSPSQPDITSFFPTSPEKLQMISNPNDRPSTPTPPATEPVSAPTLILQVPLPSHNFTLHLLDTKTRRVRSLPDHVDTITARLQLMLYHRLLSALISPDPGNQLDFPALWMKLHVNPLQTFSNRFMSQARMVLGGDENNIGFNCLDDLTRVLRERVCDLDVPGVDDTLQLIYRTQPKDARKGKNKRKREDKGKEKVFDVPMNQEELDLARAIEESLKSIGGDRTGAGERECAIDVAESLPQSHSGAAGPSGEGIRDVGIILPYELADNPDLLWVLQESLLAQPKAYGQETTDEESSESSSPVLDAAEEVPTPMPKESKILGTKEFPLDTNFLDGYLTDVLQWWHGQRPPRGVEVALSRRCFSCEYMDGCEWREKKADEWRKGKVNERQDKKANETNEAVTKTLQVLEEIVQIKADEDS